MKREEFRVTLESLLDAGLTPVQIERLSHFRRDYLEREQQLVSVQVRRLEFLRWLVATGRLVA